MCEKSYVNLLKFEIFFLGWMDERIPVYAHSDGRNKR
jgi:hypothetical protein